MRNITYLLIFFVSSLSAQPVKVMTYNIRYDNEGDGVNQWDKRKTKVFDLLKKYDPDIIGVQEALHHQLTDIAAALKGYEFFGAGRDDGKQKGEHSAIFIRKNRFKLLEQNTFWLSKTPEVPGSKDWDAAITRVVTWSRLQDKKSKQTFMMINTHFDHRGKESRRNSAALIKERAASLAKDLPVVITGDFNFTREAPPYEVMMNPSTLKLVDTAPTANAPGTACGFQVDARPCSAIDYIFHTPHWTSSNYQVIKDHDGTYYPSDHLPVMVELSLKK
jgi:endonuclease/exonuclease/phosphatase family metal-dependent hydrolase